MYPIFVHKWGLMVFESLKLSSNAELLIMLMSSIVNNANVFTLSLAPAAYKIDFANLQVIFYF